VNEPVCLEHRWATEIFPNPPFNFDATLHKPDHFPAADNVWEPGVRWQTMLWQGEPLGCKFEDRGTVDEPRVVLTVWSREELSQPFRDNLLAEIAYRYNFQLDLAEFYRLFKDDPQLGPVIARWRGMKPLNHNSLYEYLIIAIVLQNAAIRRSVNMMQALFEGYGTLLGYDAVDCTQSRELYCFWEPGTIDRATEEELRALKVGYRAKSIKRVTGAFVRGEVDEFDLRGKSKEEQREALLALYGIGPASVWYILFDVFHHLDAMDHISPWEQKIYSKLFFDREPDDPVGVDELFQTFERFGEYKMLAVHYIWEDLFWRRKYEPVAWLEELIRL
jgi:3-methyladenine DNA glycosylase/8-oxoguanine DNA glycosylase